MEIPQLIARHEQETGHKIVDKLCGFCQLAAENEQLSAAYLLLLNKLDQWGKKDNGN